MLKLKKVSSSYGMKVYTDNGEYFGDIEELVFEGNKVSSWKIKSTKESLLQKSLGTIKGVVVPHQFIRAVGDIMIISNGAISSYDNGASIDKEEEP